MIISYNTMYKRIRRFLKQLRLRPIRVFLFHQVSDVFDERTMKKGDWTEIEHFKQKITAFRQGYRFISLSDAYDRIKKDVIRCGRYAVLTSDDGWASLNSILPWLDKHSIPITLFVNPAYFDGVHFREKDTEKYLTYKDLMEICSKYPLVTIGLHGWEHVRVTGLNEIEFRDSLDKSLDILRQLPSFVSFFCYPYGDYNEMSERVLKEYNLVPVLVDGGSNIDEYTHIHRILIDG